MNIVIAVGMLWYSWLYVYTLYLYEEFYFKSQRKMLTQGIIRCENSFVNRKH